MLTLRSPLMMALATCLLCITALSRPATAQVAGDVAAGAVLCDLGACTLPRHGWSVELGWVGNSWIQDLRALQLNYAPYHGLQLTSQTGLYLLGMPNFGLKWAFPRERTWAAFVATDVFVYRPKKVEGVTLGIVVASTGASWTPRERLHLHLKASYTAVTGKVDEVQNAEGEDVLADTALNVSGLMASTAIDWWPWRFAALLLELRLPLYSAYKGTASTAGGRATTEVELTNESPIEDWTLLAGVALKAGIFRARLGMFWGPPLGGELFLIESSSGSVDKSDLGRTVFPTAEIVLQW
ncbi:MAG: hypothetical protein FJ109_13705 [Deltaproteobacteria bacterium]|nr:hypothetical protein [Deltaproteobacteria bacterium]